VMASEWVRERSLAASSPSPSEGPSSQEASSLTTAVGVGGSGLNIGGYKLIPDVESRRGAVDVPGLAKRIRCRSFEPVPALSGPSSPFPLPARRTVREDFPHTALPSGFVPKGYGSYRDGDAARK
jgi:hypothetical protein